jgi:acyl transferase domain-containing protein
LQDFDAGLFGMARAEALTVDPQQRLLLEAGHQLLAGAAAAGALAQPGLDPSATGTYVGISTPDYADLKKAAAPIGVYSATGEPRSLPPCLSAL